MIDKERWNVLSPLLNELLEADEPARAARLEQIRQADGAVADELAALLAQQAPMERAQFLEGAALPTAEPSLAGQQVGNYTLDRPLGQGGMGVVWLAHRSDGRYEGSAAIKFLSLALFGPEGLDRFKREGTVLARLTHPNIARLGDAGVTPLGQPYLVLEYIEGESIDRWCETHALDIAARIKLFMQVLDAVEHAHSKLILHRDLKPSNILVTSEGQVKLLDFGIAKLLDDGEGTRAMTELTQVAGHAFSPDYAAPEQVQGGEVTTATDVYALGVLLYLLLTGQHPTSRAMKMPVEKLRAIVETDPTRPSEMVMQPNEATSEHAKLRQRSRALRGDLDNILRKALRKLPAERYASVGALADDLRRFLNHEPVNARPASVAYQVGKFMRRYRAAVATAAGVLILLIVVAALTTAQMLEARRQRDEAQFQSRRAESVSDFLDLLLRSDGGPDRPALTLLERIDAGVKLLETQYRSDPRFAGRMLIRLSERLAFSGDIQQVIPMFERAYVLGKQVGDKELMASAQCQIALHLAHASVMQEAKEHLAEGQRLLAQADRPELNTRMECLMAQVDFEAGNGNFDAAVALLQSALQTIEAAGYTHHKLYIVMLSQLAIMHLELNHLSAAIHTFQQSIDTQERFGRGDTNDSLALQEGIAVALNAAGEVSETLARRELIKQRVRELEPEGREPLSYAINHAVALLRMGRPDEARKRVEDVLDRARQARNPATLTTLLLVAGGAYTQLGQWTQADAVLSEAAPLVNGSVPSWRSQYEMRRAQLALARGELSPARKHIESALELMRYGTDKPERGMPKALIVAADIALEQGVPADAEKFATDALAVSEAIARGPDTSADVGEALLRLAKAKIALGATKHVRPMLERSVRCLTNGLHANHPLTREAGQILSTGI